MPTPDPSLDGRVQISDLRRTFRRRGAGARLALDGASLDIAPGSLAALLGPSGCGKTTLLRCVAGFDVPDSGEIVVSGRQLVGDGCFVRPERRRVGIVAQDGALFPHLSVADNVGFGVARADRARRVAECLDLVELTDYATARPTELSGGQQQRAAVARALAPRPDVLLLDEPFSALDAGLRSRVRADIADVLRAAGITSLLVTHDQGEALSMADSVAVMFDGRVHQTDSPVALYQRPATLRIAQFFGDVDVVAASADGPTATSRVGRVVLVTAHVGAVVLALRPEQIHIGESTDGPRATVERVDYFGHDTTVSLRLDDGTVVRSRATRAVLPHVGDAVTVSISESVLAFPPPPHDPPTGREEPAT